MRIINQHESSCRKCSLTFGNNLAIFSTDFAHNLHFSTVHKQKKKATETKGQKSFQCDRCSNTFATKQSINHTWNILIKTHKKRNDCLFSHMFNSFWQRFRIYQPIPFAQRESKDLWLQTFPMWQLGIF